MYLSTKEWLLEQNDFDISNKYETCFTLTNGYMGVRGTLDDLQKDELSGTYFAGVFDKSEAQVVQLVNQPYFFGLKFYINKEYLDLSKCKMLEFYRALDMRQNLLYTKYKIEDNKSRITTIEGYRFLSIHNRHLAGQSYKFTAHNYDADILVENIIDGSTVNARFLPLERVKHYNIKEQKQLQSGAILVSVETRGKKYSASIVTSTKVSLDGENKANRKRITPMGDSMVEFTEFSIENGQSIEIDKYISVVTTRDVAKEEIEQTVTSIFNNYYNSGLKKELELSTKKLDEAWEISDIKIDGDEKAQKALRFNIFTLATTINPDDENVSIAAKGLHGEGYKGHVFWDTEIFVIPYYIYSNPKAARSLLMYRYNLLDAARENAATQGYKGARYPWESADTGLEETPRWGFDYKGNPVRIWTGDIEYHITSDIVFSILQYYRATNDLDFLLNYGFEIIIETARFWESRVEYNKEMNRYEINCVIGPDEFHEHVDNNLYTNYFARWNMKKAIELLNFTEKEHKDVYDKVTRKICFRKEEVSDWENVIEKIYIPIKSEKDIMEQHEGYFKLKDYVVTEYDENNMPLFPKEVDIVKLNDYTIIKQPDIVMLMHLLGEDFSLETKKINYDYYEKRTVHKSSLSPSIYCIMGLTVGDHKKAYEYLMRTALVDLDDNQGNTREGIHFASIGGTWQAAVFGFGGISFDSNGILCLNPTWIPENWNSFSFNICWKKSIINITIKQKEITANLVKKVDNVEVNILGKKYIVDETITTVERY